MPITFETLEAEVLRLPTADRSRLLDRVIASLDTDKARDDAWDGVAARRDAEMESGTCAPLHGPDAVARLRAELE